MNASLSLRIFRIVAFGNEREFRRGDEKEGETRCSSTTRSKERERESVHTTRDPVFSKVQQTSISSGPAALPAIASGRNRSPLRLNFALECSCGLDAARKERQVDKQKERESYGRDL